VISWVSTANQLYMAGNWSAAAAIRLRIEQLVGTLPVSHVNSGVGYLCWVSVRPVRTIHGWNKDLQTYAVRGLVPEPVYRKDEINDYPALRKVLGTGPLIHGGPYQEPHASPAASVCSDGWSDCAVSSFVEKQSSSDWTSLGRNGEDFPQHVDRSRTGCSGRIAAGHPSSCERSAICAKRTTLSERLSYLSPVVQDAEHLLRSVRRGAFTLKRRWKTA